MARGFLTWQFYQVGGMALTPRLGSGVHQRLVREHFAPGASEEDLCPERGLVLRAWS